MKKFDYEKFGNEYEKGLDYLENIIAQSPNPEKFCKLFEVEAHVNDYIKSNDEFSHLDKEEKEMVIDEIVAQYFLLNNIKMEV